MVRLSRSAVVQFPKHFAMKRPERVCRPMPSSRSPGSDASTKCPLSPPKDRFLFRQLLLSLAVAGTRLRSVAESFAKVVLALLNQTKVHCSLVNQGCLAESLMISDSKENIAMAEISRSRP